MTEALRIDPPGSIIPVHAIAFGELGAPAVQVAAGSPMPVQNGYGAAGSVPVSGTMSATGASAGFTPDLGRPIWLTLSGAWAGTVALKRSADGGATWRPATLGGSALAWTGNFNEPAAEETVAGTMWRVVFARTSGTLTYEVRQ